MPLLHRARQKSLISESLKLHRAGDYKNAKDGYELLIEQDYSGYEPYLYLADIERQAHNFDAALTLIEESLGKHPNDPEAFLTKGLILEAINQGDLQPSLNCYQQALAIDPNFAHAHYALGAACYQQGDRQKSENYYRKTIAIDPLHALAQFNLAFLLTLDESFEEAAEHYQQAVTANPRFLNAKSQYWHMRMKLCDWSNFAELENVVENELKPMGKTHQQPTFTEVFSPFTLINVQDDPQRSRAIAESFIQVIARNARMGIQLHNTSKQSFLADQAKKHMSIGFMSTDFRAHATSFLVAELFELIDNSRIDVHIFSIGEDDQSSLRQRIECSGCQFHDLVGLSDLQVAKYIAQLNIETLLDLNGLTTGSRPDILGFRPAPVQINYLAYPGTMGADFIDYIIADPFVIPQEQRSAYTEKIMYLPGCYQVNDRKRPVAAVVPSRQECHLPEKALILCCFNSNYKITPTIFAIWMDIMKELPDSVLWLFKSHDQAMKNLVKSAAEHGVISDRLIFAEKRPIHEHLARIKNADLFLDTFPCNAHTTASDALWSAIPIVTLAGMGFPSRVCGSLLKNVGLEELITNSYTQYKSVALTLAKNRTRLRDIRASLQSTVTSSILFDTQAYTHAFEHGLRHISERHRAGKEPASFIIKTPFEPVSTLNCEESA